MDPFRARHSRHGAQAHPTELGAHSEGGGSCTLCEHSSSGLPEAITQVRHSSPVPSPPAPLLRQQNILLMQCESNKLTSALRRVSEHHTTSAASPEVSSSSSISLIICQDNRIHQ